MPLSCVYSDIRARRLVAIICFRLLAVKSPADASQRGLRSRATELPRSRGSRILSSNFSSFLITRNASYFVMHYARLCVFYHVFTSTENLETAKDVPERRSKTPVDGFAVMRRSNRFYPRMHL